MRKTDYNIAIGIGDNLVIRVFMDAIKDKYEQIIISHNRNVIRTYRNNDKEYCKFLHEFGTLLFSERPYSFGTKKSPDMEIFKFIQDNRIVPRKPNLDHLLCKGRSLDLSEKYIVITTKARCLNRGQFLILSTKLWQTLRELSKQYKIVIMGEREIEKSKEYAPYRDTIFGIYEQIIANLPSDRIMDLSIPALGITTPSLKNIQQDCIIMKEAKAVITFGIGGNLWLSVCVANTIGFRTDGDPTTDSLTNPQFPTVFLTRDWKEFIHKLEGLK